MYIKQIARFVRTIYFVTLKCEELQLYQLINQSKDQSSEIHHEIQLNLFNVTIRLTAFDDMDNYNNTMKTTLNMLSKIIRTNNKIVDPEVHNILLFNLRKYYRSDMVHRKSRRSIQMLKNVISESDLPDDIKDEFCSTLEENLCNTLDDIDALLRFKFLFDDPEFVYFLKVLDKQLHKHAKSEKSLLSEQQSQALKSVTDLKLTFLKLCSDLNSKISMSFDYSYLFEDSHWMRIPNVFNLQNEILSKVETTKQVRNIQHQSRELNLDPEEVFKRDIFTQDESKSMLNVEKTVNIELQGKYYFLF